LKLRRTKRLAGFSYIGKHAYFLTICTYKRFAAFRDSDFTNQAILKLLLTAKKFGFAVFAYCFMPDHVHLVLLGERDDSALESFVKSWNTQTGYHWHLKTGGKLWQEGYYDQILRADASLIRAARYVVMNPVRAGFVEEPSAYEFCGSTCFTIAEILDEGYGPAPIDKPKGWSPQETEEDRQT
jgi:putative transposase